jgi:hypothetical protein
MMIIYETECEQLRAEAQTLLTPINIDAVGGGGLPAAFRYGFPGLFKAYCWAMKKGIFENDSLFVYDVSPERKIACMPMKQHQRYSTEEKLEYLEESLMVVATSYQKYGITSMVLNEIGYGDTELPWEKVRPVIQRCFGSIDLPVGICRGVVPV